MSLVPLVLFVAPLREAAPWLLDTAAVAAALQVRPLQHHFAVEQRVGRACTAQELHHAVFTPHTLSSRRNNTCKSVWSWSGTSRASL